MTVKKGLTTLVNNTPDFSKQHIENPVNDLKIVWVSKTFTLDTAINTNNVMTDTQNNNTHIPDDEPTKPMSRAQSLYKKK